MLAKLAVKQPRLMNRSLPLLLHDNARPHTARETVLTLQILQQETIRHPPYSPDLAPTEFQKADKVVRADFAIISTRQ
jgi:[histone H3]-lysine36 N-dimethyltransferase SETMAR